MGEFLINLLICSIGMSVLALCFIILSPAIAKKYSGKLSYYAWIIIVIGMLIPFRPTFERAVVTIKVPETAVNYYENNTVIEPNKQNYVEDETFKYDTLNGANVKNDSKEQTLIQHSKTQDFQFPTVNLIFLTWLLGCILCIVYYLWKHINFIKSVNRWNVKAEGLMIEECNLQAQQEAGVKKGLDIYKSELITTPMLVGIIKPRILLPKLDYTYQELLFMLKHEYVHYKRHDLLFKACLLVTWAVHWFNPIFKLIKQEADILCEISCDEEVLKNADSNERYQYTQTIINVIRHKNKFSTMLTTSFNGGKQGMKKRIASIMNENKKRTSYIVIALVLIATISTSAFLSTETKEDTTSPPVKHQVEGESSEEIKEEKKNDSYEYASNDSINDGSEINSQDAKILEERELYKNYTLAEYDRKVHGITSSMNISYGLRVSDKWKSAFILTDKEGSKYGIYLRYSYGINVLDRNAVRLGRFDEIVDIYGEEIEKALLEIPTETYIQTRAEDAVREALNAHINGFVDENVIMENIEIYDIKAYYDEPNKTISMEDESSVTDF